MATLSVEVVLRQRLWARAAMPAALVLVRLASAILAALQRRRFGYYVASVGGRRA